MRFPFYKSLFTLLLAPWGVWAQTPPQLPPGGLSQLQVAQLTVDMSSPATATAAFDPPVVRAGEKSFYRVSVEATESSIQWPEVISTPGGLTFSALAHGQITQFMGNKFRSLTSSLYEVYAAAPGNFAVTNLTATIAGQPVAIPAANLEVQASTPAPAGSAGIPASHPRKLRLECLATNVYLGQPVRVRVLLPAGPANEIEALREIQFTGDRLMIDKTATRQSIEVVTVDGQLKPVFMSDMVVTPMAAGALRFSAQGFTAGREFSGPISIRGQVTLPGGVPKYVLLVSDPLEIRVHPLPTEKAPPGFTGTMGKFSCDPPQLSTNRLRVGEPVHLKVVYHSQSELARFIPPVPPRTHDWQIIADKPPAMGFTLIPLTDETRATPAIPFSYFDPATATFVDLTITPQPVTVVGEGLQVQLPAFEADADSALPLTLSGLAPTPGKTVASLKPLQQRAWFVVVQLVPVIGFIALWHWDRRRRFLEAHPEIVRRRQALRALRHKKQELQMAAAAGDAVTFFQQAAAALSIAVAPHYPANPQALVCADVLAQLTAAERDGLAGNTVRRVFAAADARFALAPQSRADIVALHSEITAILLALEGKL